MSWIVGRISRSGGRARQEGGSPATDDIEDHSGTAAAGEVLVSVAAAEEAGRGTQDAERRSLKVRGRQKRIDVLGFRP